MYAVSGMEDVEQETRLKDMKRIIRKIERRCRINPTEQRWESETLVNDCETAWLDTTCEYIS